MIMDHLLFLLGVGMIITFFLTVVGILFGILLYQWLMKENGQDN